MPLAALLCVAGELQAGLVWQTFDLPSCGGAASAFTTGQLFSYSLSDPVALDVFLVAFGQAGSDHILRQLSVDSW